MEDIEEDVQNESFAINDSDTATQKETMNSGHEMYEIVTDPELHIQTQTERKRRCEVQNESEIHSTNFTFLHIPGINALLGNAIDNRLLCTEAISIVDDEDDIPTTIIW